MPCDLCGASADWQTGGGAAGEFYACAGCRARFDAEPENAGVCWSWIGRRPEPAPLVAGDAAAAVEGAPGWAVVLLVVGAVAVAVYVAAGLVS